ncbi:MAG: helix-turn-helix transcriptional regulator [Dysgonomonas sp.]
MGFFFLLSFDLNKEWLVDGVGEKYKTKNKYISEARPIDINFTLVSLIPIRARAGYLAGYGDPEYIKELPTMPVITDKTFHGEYRCFEIDGDSMDNGTIESIKDKDVILGREIKKDLWKYKLHINKWKYFVIIHKDGIMVKQIIDHDIEKCVIICHSLSPLYPEDFKLNLDDICELYNVIKIVDRPI